MKRPALGVRVWLGLTHAFVLLLPLGILIVSGGLLQDLREQTRNDLHNQAALLAILASAELAHAPEGSTLDDVGPALNPRLIEAKESTLAGIRVVAADGIVVATSGDELGEDFTDRPEVRAALKGAETTTIRPRPPQSRRQPLASPSRSADVRLFVATPVMRGDHVVGAVILSRTPREETQALYQIVPAWGPILAAFTTLVVAWAVGSASAREVTRLGGIAARIGAGEIGALDLLARPERSIVREVASLAQAVSAMAVRLRDRLRYIAEFASNVSHEFKTPITTLRGTVELLRDDAEMPAEQRARFLDNALAELDRLDRLVGGLLDLARAEQPGERSSVDLLELARRVALRHGVVADGTPVRVQVDAAQVEAALDNLVSNALRYGAPPIAVTVGSDHGHACVDVIDHGAGLSEANRARVFDRFFTTGRDRGGTGLGLALVRAVAEAHGGAVELTSEPGLTRFRLVFLHAP